MFQYNFTLSNIIIHNWKHPGTYFLACIHSEPQAKRSLTKVTRKTVCISLRYISRGFRNSLPSNHISFFFGDIHILKSRKYNIFNSCLEIYKDVQFYQFSKVLCNSHHQWCYISDICKHIFIRLLPDWVVSEKM